MTGLGGASYEDEYDSYSMDVTKRKFTAVWLNGCNIALRWLQQMLKVNQDNYVKGVYSNVGIERAVCRGGEC